jgi:hypothetical protein
MQGAHHLEDRGELRIAVLAERAVQMLARELRLAGDLRHAPGPRDDAERVGDEGGVLGLQGRGHVLGTRFVALQMLGGIERKRF